MAVGLLFIAVLVPATAAAQSLEPPDNPYDSFEAGSSADAAPPPSQAPVPVPAPQPEAPAAQPLGRNGRGEFVPPPTPPTRWDLTDDRVERGPPGGYRPRWYGWQILLAAGGAASVGVVGGTAEGNGAAPWFMGVHGLTALSSPVIHVANRGHPMRAVGGFLLEGGGPFGAAMLGAIVGDAVGEEEERDPDGGRYPGSALAGFAYGYLIGYFASVVIDSGALAWKYEPTRGQPPKATSAVLVPLVRVGKDAAWAGLSGSL